MRNRKKRKNRGTIRNRKRKKSRYQNGSGGTKRPERKGKKRTTNERNGESVKKKKKKYGFADLERGLVAGFIGPGAGGSPDLQGRDITPYSIPFLSC
jgi:hypothetical protein